MPVLIHPIVTVLARVEKDRCKLLIKGEQGSGHVRGFRITVVCKSTLVSMSTWVEDTAAKPLTDNTLRLVIEGVLDRLLHKLKRAKITSGYL